MHYQTDIAIIGAGAAGIAAGIEASDAGARAIAFEKYSEPGGAAIISGGGCLIVGSPVQEAKGIHDTPALAFDDWIRWGGPSTDALWARYYIDHTLHDLYRWSEALGVTWADLKEQEGNSVRRWTRSERNGLGLMTHLIDGFCSKGGKLVAETEITRLRIENGRVGGLDGRNSRTGEPITVASRAVVVATGGFNSNLDMVLEHYPALRNDRVLVGSGPGSTGSGHMLVHQAGGYFTHMDHIWFYVYATPDYRDPAQRRGLVFRVVPGYIWVNQQGRRFHNEALSGGNSATPALLAQSPRHAWAIMDAPMTATMEIADPYYRDGDKVAREKVAELLDNSPYIRKADTLAGLAASMQVDVPEFLTTVARYNGACEQQLEAEPEFGKPMRSSKAFDTPPYYAVQMFPLARKNFGGVKTDLQCRVLDSRFAPIAGLYAAGEVAGMAGGHINGRAGLEGTMLGPSVFSGRVAGGWAAQAAGYGRGFAGTPLHTSP
ncbi:MAG TPA: FAD-dependent oxidoreductase [Xanthobacteraceae bacterium]|jgi:predicted oxidoreductase